MIMMKDLVENYSALRRSLCAVAHAKLGLVLRKGVPQHRVPIEAKKAKDNASRYSKMQFTQFTRRLRSNRKTNEHDAEEACDPESRVACAMNS